MLGLMGKEEKLRGKRRNLQVRREDTGVESMVGEELRRVTMFRMHRMKFSKN